MLVRVGSVRPEAKLSCVDWAHETQSVDGRTRAQSLRKGAKAGLRGKIAWQKQVQPSHLCENPSSSLQTGIRQVAHVHVTLTPRA